MWRDGTILLVNALDTNIHQDLLLDTNRVSLYKIKQKELSEIKESTKDCGTASICWRKVISEVILCCKLIIEDIIECETVDTSVIMSRNPSEFSPVDCG